jgi:hypothetical protein
MNKEKRTLEDNCWQIEMTKTREDFEFSGFWVDRSFVRVNSPFLFEAGRRKSAFWTRTISRDQAGIAFAQYL